MQQTERISAEISPLPIDMQTRRKRFTYDLVLVLMSIIWGACFLVTKDTLKVVGTFTFLGLCDTVATLTLALIFHRHLMRLTREEFLKGSLIGAILFAGYALQTLGIQLTTVSKTGFIAGLYVPLVPLFAFLFFRQRIPLTALIGVGLSLAGLLLLSLDSQAHLVFGPGELLLLGCAVTFAIQIVLIGRFAPKVDTINMAIVQLGVAALLSLLMVPLTHEQIAPPVVAWLPIVLVGIIDMAFTLTAMNWIQQYISSTRAALIYSLEPIWTAFFGVLLAGDVLSLPAWLGCGCIFAGMIIGRLDGIHLHRHKRK